MKQSKYPLIFIVDGNKNYRRLVMNSLMAIDYNNIEEYATGRQCLENLYQAPDIVIQEYNLDDINGLELLKKMKINRPHTDFIFLSSQSDTDVVASILKSGAVDYIAKTKYAIGRLAQKIDQLITSKRELDKSVKVEHSLLYSLGFIFISMLSLIVYYTKFS
ncbi:MAG: response regulator [Bacteroidales bacterium]|nr:response regulator [Bacteroidales bacterium]